MDDEVQDSKASLIAEVQIINHQDYRVVVGNCLQGLMKCVG
jgi:hypothetical protein